MSSRFEKKRRGREGRVVCASNVLSIVLQAGAEIRAYDEKGGADGECNQFILQALRHRGQPPQDASACPSFSHSASACASGSS